MTIQTRPGLTLLEAKHEAFAERINPRNLGFSPKLVAIVGAIIGYDYGVRDGRGGHLISISITSDGYVTAHSTASNGGGAFLGSADDLDRNLEQFVMVLHDDVSDEDAEEFERVYAARVYDYRSGRNREYRNIPK